MAFPTTSVLDDFNRANGDPGASWTSPLWIGSGKFQIVSNQIEFSPGGAEADGYWNPATFGPDSEVYLDFPTFSFGCSLLIRIASPGAAANGYRIQFLTSAAAIYRIDAGTATKLGANITATFVDGNSGGADVVGSTITAYQKSGTWAALDTRSDSTYTAAGNIGVTSSQDLFGDNFGGGTIVTAGATLVGAFQARAHDLWGRIFRHRVSPANAWRRRRPGWA